MSATTVYLALNLPLFTACAAVLIHYGSQGIPRVDRWGPHHWLIAGILFGFLGKILDAIYWHAAWSSQLFGVENDRGFLRWGTAANIPLRQVPILASAGCHLVGAWLVMGRDRQKVMPLVMLSLGLGIILFLASTLLAVLYALLPEDARGWIAEPL